MEEIWGASGVFYLPDENDRNKKNEPVEPMGPKHPMWNFALDEVRSLLTHAERVFDEDTVESVAMDHDAWMNLIKEASAVMTIRDKENRMAMLTGTIGKIREDAESELRLNNLFGGNTKTTPPQNPF